MILALMPRKKKPLLDVLEDPTSEALAQELADGATQTQAWLNVDRSDLEPSEREKLINEDLSKRERTNFQQVAHHHCTKPVVKQRVNSILAERHKKRLSVKLADLSVNNAYVTDRLMTIVDRCMQAEPVKNGQGNAVGMYRFDSNGAVKSLELLGLEQGMFERKHKHLHAKQNPLEGNRAAIVGRLSGLLDQLSDADLRSIGLQRLELVEVSFERIDGVDGEQGAAVSALSETTGLS